MCLYVQLDNHTSTRYLLCCSSILLSFVHRSFGWNHSRIYLLISITCRNYYRRKYLKRFGLYRSTFMRKIWKIWKLNTFQNTNFHHSSYISQLNYFNGKIVTYFLKIELRNKREKMTFITISNECCNLKTEDITVVKFGNHYLL